MYCLCQFLCDANKRAGYIFAWIFEQAYFPKFGILRKKELPFEQKRNTWFYQVFLFVRENHRLVMFMRVLSTTDIGFDTAGACVVGLENQIRISKRMI